jgi:hypothetical protein
MSGHDGNFNWSNAICQYAARDYRCYSSSYLTKEKNMRFRLSHARRFIIIGLCVSLLLPFLPRQAAADDGPRIIIDIGQPAIWSLGQAHYLLARMHRTNNKLNTKFPQPDDLDANKIAATRIEALRSSLGVEAQFDQSMAVKNEMSLRRFRESEARRETASADLHARRADLPQVNTDLLDMNEQIAVLEEEDRQSTEARNRSTPPAPPTAEDNDRKKEIVRLKVKRDRKVEERTELKSQITSLTTTSDTATPAPTLETPALTTTTPTLPNPDTFKDFTKKAIEEAGKPDLSASMKLDNFVQMQYEIISKQLTLLRDEVGPDDRVVFLELPASIYTVDKKADDYVAQVEWEVENVCDKEPPPEIQEQVIRDILLKEGKDKDEADDILMRIDKARDAIIERRAREVMRQDAVAQTSLSELSNELNRIDATEATKKDRIAQEEKTLLKKFIEKEREKVRADDRYGKSSAPYPITLDMIKEYEKKPEGRCMAVDREKVRAIDIIPRQSALNVNERHAVVKETMFLAAFKFLVGFAGKVNFQRQRELYEQFVQQQTFASGYGKGDDRFGWTYGPQPGTRRIAPGQRTTFAVLVVPRNTLAVRLKAQSKFYKRNKSPQDPDKDDVMTSKEVNYLLSVPGKRTQEFWVDGVSYTPVKKGRRVTAVIEGNYFSPQLGILVNGVPLEPVISVSRAAGGDEEADVQNADSVVGEYEITNSRQIILSFKMGDDYVGTPNITFTSPEKTTPINFFDIKINHHSGLRDLQEQSVLEPMFMDEFNVGKKLEPVSVTDVCSNITDPLVLKKIKDGHFGLARFTGQGLRPDAEIAINNVGVEEIDKLKIPAVCNRIKKDPESEFAMQDSTKAYLLYFKSRGGAKRKVAYRQPTRQGYEEGSIAEDFSEPTVKVNQRHYNFNPSARRGEIDLTFAPSEKGSTIEDIALDDPADGSCLRPRQEGSAKDGFSYRVKCLIPGGSGGKIERDFITVRLTLRDKDGAAQDDYEDITLPVRPQVLSVVNPRTGYAAGFVEEEPTVIISGVNLQGVTSVFFGDKEVKVNGTASPDSIAVKVPKGASVAKGQAAAVPVILQTSGGQLPTGAVYTYLGEPPTPNVVVWPYPFPGKQP